MHQWSKSSLVLHSIFAVAVISQLISSEFMQGSTPIFYLHVAGGLTALVSLVIYLALKFKQHKLAGLYPYSRLGLVEVMTDLINMVKFKSLPDRQAGGLPGLVQGLGVLLILAMALTGASGFIIYHWLPWKQAASFLIDIHSTFATFVWIYIIGHAAMACLHWIVGYYEQ
jgi:cytochrome b561